MAGSFLTGLGTLWGGAGNAGAASSNAWNYGQYSPFTVNNPAGQISFNGTTASSQLSPLQQSLQNAFGSSIQGGLGAGYNPNTSFLPQQYQNIFSQPQFQAGVNNQFQNSVNGIMPFLQQSNQSNLDNEFSKGTLASTAGQYQTAGQNMATGGILSNLYNTAFGNQLGLANSQFGAAANTAGQREQQAEFGPQFGLAQANTGLSGLNSQNTNFLQMLQAGGNLGAQRSGANVAAAMPGIQTGMIQDQASSGLLSGLLFGGGTTGGLLNGLLGGAGSGMGGLTGLLRSAGNGISSLFGGGSGGAGQFANWADSSQPYTGNGGDSSAWQTGNPADVGNPQPGDMSTGDQGMNNWWGDSGFKGAGGQAANSSSPALNYAATANSLLGLGNKMLGSGGSQALGTGSGYLSNVLGIYNGLMKGSVSGDAQAAIGATGLAAKSGLLGGYGGLAGQAASYAAIPLSLYNEINSWQSGNTLSDAAGGASTGAAIGSVVPGVGTAIGALVGGAAGALSSAFGPGKKDPETYSSDNLINAVGAGQLNQQQIASGVQNPYLDLAGLMDERSSTLPMYQAYGRMGEEQFTKDMIGLIGKDKSQGMSEANVYNNSVTPWIASMGSGWNNVGSTYKSTTQGLIEDMVNQIYSGSYKQNFKARGGQEIFNG